MFKEFEIYTKEKQPRFEAWAEEDLPIKILPETIEFQELTREYLADLVEIYRRVFNAQNIRLYFGNEGAKLAWDEAPWTEESARTQLLCELSSETAVCFIATARTEKGKSIAVGFIIARQVGKNDLAKICGEERISELIFQESGNPEKILLWEDAGVLNLETSDGKTVRGVGKTLYKRVAEVADLNGFVSIGRTASESFSNNILPKVGFTYTGINDGIDTERYWLIRFPKNYER